MKKIKISEPNQIVYIYHCLNNKKNKKWQKQIKSKKNNAKNSQDKKSVTLKTNEAESQANFSSQEKIFDQRKSEKTTVEQKLRDHKNVMIHN